MNNQKEQWDNSYLAKGNFLFHPHEEIIRFVSKYIRKRTGLEDFRDVRSFTTSPRLLDLGCGIGRHIIFASQMGIETYGVDLSDVAIHAARRWAAIAGIAHPEERIRQGDIRHLPWGDEYFDYVVSHGVLDSMHFEVAKTTLAEVARVMTRGGLFYCDLISGDDSSHSREFAGEEVVSTDHEHGTVQSYFSFAKVQQLADRLFDVVDCVLIRREDILAGGYFSRYHLVFKKR